MGSRFYRNRSFIALDSLWITKCCRGLLDLGIHISKIAPYELPQVIAQIPPPPVDVPMPIRKALSVDGESKVVNYLLHGEYEMTNTYWSKLQKKYNLVKIKYILLLKEKKTQRVPVPAKEKANH